MSELIRVTGKTVEDAITSATIRLGVASDHIVYTVIEHESKGFLGIGQKDAVIEVRIKTEADYEAERLKNKVEKEAAAEKAKEGAADSGSFLEQRAVPKVEKPVSDNAVSEKPASGTAADTESAPQAEAAASGASGLPEEEEQSTADGEKARPSSGRREREIVPLENPQEAIDKAEHFLRDVYSAMGMDVELVSNYDGEVLNVQMNGDDMGILIGKRGQTLDSLQYLVSLVVNKGSSTYVRVKLDTENYRERRKATLENLAKNISVKVKKSRQSVYLEPMNPYERRIIHSALQGDPFVTTYSEGEEPNRKVVVALKKDADLDALDRKYGERRSRGGYRNSRGKGGRGDRRSSRRQNRESGNEMAEYIEPVQIPDAPAENSGETFTEE